MWQHSQIYKELAKNDENHILREQKLQFDSYVLSNFAV